MFTITFQNKSGEERVIAKKVEESNILKVIHGFLDEKGFKSYYTRSWNVDTDGRQRTKYDVGSHTEFFYAEKEKEDVPEIST